MVQDYNGAAVVDATGERFGTVERSYVDDTGAVRAVGVKLGKLFARHRLVPVDGAVLEHDELRVPYTKDTIEGSPDVDPGDTLEGDTLDRVWAYYSDAGRLVQVQAEDESRAQPPQPAVAQTGAPVQGAREPDTTDTPSTTWDEARRLGRVRDLGDVIEVPIVEEEIVKRPVVKEVLRLRKTTTTSQQEVSEDLRKEDIEIDREGDVDVKVDDQRRP